MITAVDLERWAEYLLDAEERRSAVAPISEVAGDLEVNDALAVQAEVLRRRVARGERLVGAKLGLTSRAKQEAMGVRRPVIGWLTSSMMLATDEPVRLSELVHPRAEPEIVFLLRRALRGPGVGVADVLDAATVCCGIEIIDLRYADFRFTASDVIADNTSAARFVLGPVPVEPAFDLSLVGCILEVDGSIVSTAAGAAVLGHPAEAVAMLANALAASGREVEAGWVVMSGGLVNAVPLHDGTNVTATFGRLGRVGVRAAG